LNRDLALVSRAWETAELPKERRFLLKYFDTPVQEAWLRYFLVFNDYAHFCDHTGHICQVRWMKILHEKLIFLENLKAKARAEMDLTLLTRLEDGKYNFSKQK
jgi:hypothetical protein